MSKRTALALPNLMKIWVRGEPKFGFNSRNQGDLGNLHISTNHTNCRVPFRDQKHENGSGIQGGTKIIYGVDLTQRGISKNSETVWGSTHGSPCFQVVPPGAKVCKSSYPDPHTWMVDAFLLNWKNLQPYVFPPFALIGQVLAKVIPEKCQMILATPVWPSQVW